MSEKSKSEKAIERISAELQKIDRNENHVYFFVLDTEGYPSGSLAYIYHLAMFARNAGYNVAMLYQSEEPEKGRPASEFVGVGGWLGKEYAELPHYDVREGKVEIGASDILFIPEIFAQVMNQTKSLPCKRIAVMQNYDYILAQTPYSAEWGSYGIMDAISNTEENAALLKGIFPYVRTTVIPPFIEKMFCESKQPRKMVVNIVAHDQDDVTRVVKPFYWKFPLMKWVSFRDLRGFPKERFAEALRESFLTIWIDNPASFGYSALEALRCGNVVFAKIPSEDKAWMTDGKGEGYNDSCIWFHSINDMHDKIATLVRGFITDTIPEGIYKGREVLDGRYTEEASEKAFLKYMETVIDDRKAAMAELIKVAQREGEKHEEDKK